MTKAVQRKRKVAKKHTPAKQLALEKRRADREKLIMKVELALRAHGFPKWHREVPFDGTKRRLDIAWPFSVHAQVPMFVAIEAHGGIWSNGRHVRGQGFTDDRAKMNDARLAGFFVIEITEQHVDNGMMVEWVKRALNTD